jgi:hypothetical protein
MNTETKESPNGVPFDELMLLFAETIFAKAELVRSQRPDRTQTSVLRDAIKWDIKSEQLDCSTTERGSGCDCEGARHSTRRSQLGPPAKVRPRARNLHS